MTDVAADAPWRGERGETGPVTTRRSVAVALNIVGLSVTVDLARVWWSKGVRTGLVVAVVTLVGLQWLPGDAAVSLALGAAFTGISDTTDPDRNRFAGLLLTVVAFSVAVCVGGGIADSDLGRIVGSAVAAAVCGFVVVVGPRTALAGVICLVLVVVYAGTPGTLVGGLEAAGWVATGGLVYIVAALPDWPLHRFTGLRTTLSTGFRSVGLAAGSPGHEISATSVAMAPLAALMSIRNGDTRGTTREWALGLAEDCDAARRSLAALSTHHSAAADELRLAAARAIRHVGGALQFAVWRTRALDAAETSRAAAALARSEGVPEVLVSAVDGPVQRAAAKVAGRWPIGRCAETGPPGPLFDDPITRLRAALHWSDGGFQHALRLCAAIAIATVVAVLLPVEHSYWIPLTVAWITRPDLGGTVTRVAMRVAGTLLGVGVAWLVAPHLGGDISFAIVVGAGAFTISAFVAANYPLAVAGITTMVLVLLGSVGEPVRSMVPDRFVDTLIAAGIVLFVVLVAPRTPGGTVHRDLSALARQAAAYCNAVFSGQPGDMARMRLDVLHARTKAEEAALVAAQEPVHHALDPAVALEIMADLRRVSEQLLLWHEQIGTVAPPAELAELSQQGLSGLAERLQTPEDPGPTWEFPAALPEAATDLLGPIAHAHRRLTDAVA